MYLVLALVLVALVACGSGADAKLVGMVGISRHGTRAANPSLSTICPNDRANVVHYEEMGLSPGGLTGKGMEELYELGEFTRKRYVDKYDLIQDHASQSFLVQAVESERTLQSAWAFGQGLYPAGKVPAGYKKDLSGPVAVYSVPAKIDNLLETRKAGCSAQVHADQAEWEKTEGVKLLAETQNELLLNEFSKLCGYDLAKDEWPAVGNNIKDISDAITFDYYSGFKSLGGMSIDQLNDLRRLAVDILFGRLYNSDAQKTYMSGDLPLQIYGNFLNALEGEHSASEANPPRRAWMYHSHREQLYAIAFFLGLEFDVPGVGVPKGAIPAAATLFFELYDDVEEAEHDEMLKQVHHIEDENGARLKRDVRHGDSAHVIRHDEAREAGKVVDAAKDGSRNQEEHKVAEDPKQRYVRVLLWRPDDACAHEETGKDTHGHCTPITLKIPGCATHCPLEVFKEIIDARNLRTQPWSTLCHVGAADAPEPIKENLADIALSPAAAQTTKPTEASAVADPGTLPASGHMSIWAFVIGTLIVGCALTVVKVKFPSLLGMHASAQGYDRIDEV